MKNTIALITPAPVSHRTAEENLGIGYLAKILRENHYEVLVVDGWLEGLNTAEITNKILSKLNEILLVGVSCYRSNIEKAKELVLGFKQADSNLPILAGGYGPTFHSEDFLNAGFDLVAIGEAENTILKVANYFSGKETSSLKEIKGIAYKQNDKIIETERNDLIQDIDSLPFPDRDTIHLAMERKCAINILSSRGCQANCIFCSIVAFQRKSNGNKWRQRSVHNFVDEIETLYNLGVRHFKVIDDSFIEPPRDSNWCKDLADEISKRNMKVYLRGSIRADRVNNEILYHLRRAGFFSFSCGIENGSQTALKRMGKSARVTDNLTAISLFKKHKIFMQAGMILFDPGTNFAELEENFQFLSQNSWIITKGIFTEMYAAEGTPFYNKIEKTENIKEAKDVLGNHQYLIADYRASVAYNLLKRWHKHLCKLYDKAIDPISCPKALTDIDYENFYSIYLRLNKMNLLFFNEVLILIKNKEISSEEQILFVDTYFDKMKDDILKANSDLDELYKEVNLIYDANSNPFLN